MRQCKICHIEIPFDRLEVLPYTDTCVKHSEERAYVGVLEFSHKTAPYLVKTKSEESERRMWRAYRRSR